MIENYVVTDVHGSVEKILCKCCGATIQSLVQIANPVSRRLSDGTVIQQIPMALRPTADYADIKIEMKDGAFRHYHCTPICKHCIPKLTSQDLQALFRIDLMQFRREGTPDKHLQHWLKRKAIKVIDHGDAQRPVI